MGIIVERQKAVGFPGWHDEGPPTRLGAFKLSTNALKHFKEMGIENPEDSMFPSMRKVVHDIPRSDLPKIWGADNMADAQDVIARNPKLAFREWMKNIGKVSPKLARGIRKYPDQVPVWFYMTVVAVSGRDMADIILKQYLSAKPSQAWRGKMKKEDAMESNLRDRSYLTEGQMKLRRVKRSLDTIGQSLKDAESAYKKLSSDEQRFAPQKDNLKADLGRILTAAKVAMRSLGEDV